MGLALADNSDKEVFVLRKAVKSYLVAGRQAGLSDTTLKQYEWHLVRMTNWLLDHPTSGGVDRVADVTRDLLREWGAGLRDAWSPATVKQAVGAARAFFRWCYEEGIIDSDPGRALRVPKVPKRVQRTITAGEVALLLGACDLNTAKGARDAAIVLLLVDTGLRASEVCRCEVTKLELERRRLVVRVKGGHDGLARFGKATAWRLAAWLNVRSSVAVEGIGNVFVSVGGNTPGRALTVRGLRSVLGRLGDVAGVAGVTTHAFRRGFACITHQLGAPSRQVMGVGRWAHIREVERYTRSLEIEGFYDRWSPADHIENSILGV